MAYARTAYDAEAFSERKIDTVKDMTTAIWNGWKANARGIPYWENIEAFATESANALKKHGQKTEHFFCQTAIQIATSKGYDMCQPPAHRLGSKSQGYVDKPSWARGGGAAEGGGK